MNKHKMISCILLFLCLCSVILFGYKESLSSAPLKVTDYYFNTVISFTFYSSKDASYSDDCFALCNKYEHLFSRTIEGSDIWNINHSDGEWVNVSEETLQLLHTALKYSEMTNGKIDISVAPLMELWDFTSEGVHTCPQAEEIAALLPHVNTNFIEIDGERVRLIDPEAEIDLGFIAKGYVADSLKKMLLDLGVKHAIIDLGGNILTIGSKPDSSAYVIGIQKPFSEQNESIATVSVNDSSIVTSGTYERYFMEDGVCYHHILDPDTGYPVQTDLTGVTILSPTSMQGDALSTTCLLLGLEDGMKLINQTDGVEAIFITSDYAIHYSDGLK